MTDSPVIVRLHRGLGNKLFQFAAGRALADRLDAPLHLVAGPNNALLASLLGPAWQPATGRELWRCGIAHPVPARPSALDPVVHTAARARRLAARANHALRGTPLRRLEPLTPHTYDPMFERLTAPCYLIGYFQHRRYWEDVIDDLTAELRPGLGLAPRGDRAPGRPIIGLHLRRADFLTMGWALGPAYYRRALDRFRDLPSPLLRLVGDDPAFLAELARRLRDEGHDVESSDVVRSEPSDRSSMVTDLVRLAECDHLVLSNSTFAWWAAALGDPPAGSPADRRVILPSTWTAGFDADVLLRPGWEAVPAGADPGLRGPAVYESAGSFDEWWCVSPS